MPDVHARGVGEKEAAIYSVARVLHAVRLSGPGPTAAAGVQKETEKEPPLHAALARALVICACMVLAAGGIDAAVCEKRLMSAECMHTYSRDHVGLHGADRCKWMCASWHRCCDEN